MKRLFTHAKVRKLDRVAVGYLLAAWVAIQAGSIALPAFEAPPWAMKLLIAASVVGLPLTLLVAWFWRIGPEPDAPDDNTLHPLWGRTEVLLVGLLAFVLITGAIEFAIFFAPRNTASEGMAANAAESRASIAVLPFANLSGDPSKRYFSDGIADQLISELSKTPALRVASRTSSFAVAEKKMDVKALGQALNVKTVLEGSVREEGGRVRIAAQLINAADGFEMWSSTFDRDLTDILTLQDEIARSITQALQEKLVGHAFRQAPHPKPHPIDPAAYRDYLQAKFIFAQRSESSVKRAVELLEKVTQQAPDFPDGHALLADARATLAFNFNDQNQIAPALYAVKQALKLDPNNITALAAHATASLMMWKWLTAAEDVRLMQRRAPNNAQVWHNSSIFYAYMGLPDLTVEAAKRAVELDPLSYVDRSNLAVYAIISGDFEGGLQLARDALALQPGNVDALAGMCEALAATRKFDKARQIYNQIESLSAGNERIGEREACRFWIAAYSGDVAVARSIVEQILPGFPDNGVPAGDVSTAYRVMGENGKALEWYRRALDGHEIGALSAKYFAKGPREIFDTPEWKEARNRPDVIMWENARSRIAREFGSKVSGI